MKKLNSVLFLLLLVCLILPLFSACGGWGVVEVDPDVESIEDAFLGKYYINSKENKEEELWGDFEYRLVSLYSSAYFDQDPEIYKITRDQIRDMIIEECTLNAVVYGISFEDYVREHYSKDGTYNSESPHCDVNSPYYYSDIASGYYAQWLGVNYLAKLWDIEADQNDISDFLVSGMTVERAKYEALKLAVFNYSVDNSKIVYRHKSPWLYLLVKDFWDTISTNGNFAGYYYAIGEDGYGAVYVTRFETTGDDLEPYVGEQIFGSSSYLGLFRFTDKDRWDHIVVRRGVSGDILVKFDHWIEEGSSEYDDFVALYGFEPKIHP